MPRGALEIKTAPISMQGPQTLCSAYANGVAFCACAHSFCSSSKSTFCGAFNSPKFGGCREACCPPPPVAASMEKQVELPHDSPLYRDPCGPSCRVQGRRVRVRLKPKSSSDLCGPLRYIIDSGSAFDIANLKECSSALLARVCNLDPSLEMSTVNGHITVTDGLRIEVPALRRNMQFALLPHSPSIISLGRFCMLSGFSLHWPARQAPYLVDPDGRRIDLVVENYVPYIWRREL